MLGKSLIQFSVDGWCCVPSLLLDLRPNYGGAMKTMATSFKRSQACTAVLSAPSLQQATANPRILRRLLDTHGQVWVSLFCGHCFFLLGPGTHRLCLCPPSSVFSVLCKFWRLSGGVMVTSSKRACAIPRSTAPRAPAPVAVHC